MRRFFTLAIVATALVACSSQALAQGRCAGGGRRGGAAPSMATAGMPMLGTTTGAAFGRAYARQAYMLQLATQRAYRSQQLQRQREYLKQQEELASDREEARQKKLDALRERRQATLARREAAKAKRLEAKKNASMLASE